MSDDIPDSSPLDQPDPFEEAGVSLNKLGDAVVGAVNDVMGSSVSIVMFLIHDETGRVASTSNLLPEQMGDFLSFALQSHRTGEYTLSQPNKETAQ